MFAALFAVNSVQLFGAVCTGAMIIGWRHTKVIKAASPRFCVLVVLGCIMCYILIFTLVNFCC